MILWKRAWQPTPVFLPGKAAWTDVPGRLQSVVFQRVRHDWATKHIHMQFHSWGLHPHELITLHRLHLLIQSPEVLGSNIWLLERHKHLDHSKRLCMGSFEGGPHYHHYLHHSLASGKYQGENTAPPVNRTCQQKTGLKIYWVWPHPSEQDPVSPIRLSHQEASLSVLSFFIRGQTDWKPQSQKTNQSDHMNHSLV